MRKLTHGWLAAGVAILLLTAGCFQQGDGIDAFSVADNLNPTFTPSLFPTPEPIFITQEVVVTATPDPFAQPFPADDFGTGGAIPTLDPFLQPPTLDLGIAQQPLDDIAITATFIIARATQTQSYILTATAGGVFPTATEFALFTATPDPNLGAGGGVVISGQDCIHTVQRGENLFRIALRYGVTIDAIVARSTGITNINQLLVGQELVIPGCGTTGQVPPPTVPDQPGVATPIPSQPIGCTNPYTVQQGDTLFKISLACGVPMNSIASANGISNINVIVVNQQLVIPPS